MLASVWKPEACGQTVLPDRSRVIGQKLEENAKIQKFKYNILSIFQTLLKVIFMSACLHKYAKWVYKRRYKMING